MTDFSEQVQTGAAYLDVAVGTHWPLLIDLDKLDMKRCNRCIVGQVLGFTDLQLEEWNMTDWNNLASGDVDDYVEGRALERARGFNLDLLDDTQWSELATTWVAEIKRRLDEGIAL